jgi:hypothetical protein
MDTTNTTFPEHIFSQFKIDVTGEVQITFFAKTEPLQVLNILESPNAINELIHKEGVFIDYSKLQKNMVKLRLSTTTLLDPNIDVLQSMEVIVHTISKELYDYHQSLHKQLINNATPFTTPVSSFSNIEQWPWRFWRLQHDQFFDQIVTPFVKDRQLEHWRTGVFENSSAGKLEC